MTRPSTLATFVDDCPFPSSTYDAPVEEEKYEGYYDCVSSEVDAEQWLTRKDGPKYHNKEKENLRGGLTCKDAVESQGERSLARENRDLLLQWKRNDEALDERHQPVPSLEARSSVSSPGKSSLREKLQYRLQKRHEIRLKQMKADQNKPRMDRYEADESADEILGAWTCETQPSSPMSDSGLSTSVDHHDYTIGTETTLLTIRRMFHFTASHGQFDMVGEENYRNSRESAT